MKKRLSTILLILLILVPVTFQIFRPYVLGTADGLAHKFRLVSFMNSIREGNIRPRWLSDQALGYGSPIFLFNYLLPYYVISAIKTTGFDIRTSVQVYEAITIILSFYFMCTLVEPQII